jgi:hypothetical protein
MLIVAMAGVACQVFPSFDAICQEFGHLTLGELAEDKFQYGYVAFHGAQGYLRERTD